MTSPARERGLAVTGDERVHRQHARAAARGEHHRRVERDQAGNRAPDRGSGREIAGDGSEIANLARPDAAHECPERGKVPIEVGQGPGVGDRAAEFDGVGPGRDPTQLLDRAERDHGRQDLAILAHAKPEIGAAREQDCVGVLRHGGKQRSERARHEKGLAAVAIVGACRQGCERSRGRRRLRNKTIGWPMRDAAAGLHDRAVAGTAAEIAGERFHG